MHTVCCMGVHVFSRSSVLTQELTISHLLLEFGYISLHVEKHEGCQLAALFNFPERFDRI